MYSVGPNSLLALLLFVTSASAMTPTEGACVGKRISGFMVKEMQAHAQESVSSLDPPLKTFGGPWSRPLDARIPSLTRAEVIVEMAKNCWRSRRWPHQHLSNALTRRLASTRYQWSSRSSATNFIFAQPRRSSGFLLGAKVFAASEISVRKMLAQP